MLRLWHDLVMCHGRTVEGDATLAETQVCQSLQIPSERLTNCLDNKVGLLNPHAGIFVNEVLGCCAVGGSDQHR